MNTVKTARPTHNYVSESVSSPPELGGPIKIWDVARLQALAAELPARWVPLAEIRDLDRVGWYGSEGHCGRLTVREVADHAKRIAAADLSYPVIISAEGFMLDGFHRLAKAYQEGRTQILAKQFTTDPEPERTQLLPSWIQCAAERGSI